MLTIKPSIGNGNIKVGPIPTFSLPAQASCPGATPWCIQHCYAKRYERMRPNCQRAYERNLKLSRNPRRFVREMLKHIPRDTPVLRIHVSGDFYDARYIYSWVTIARQRPRTKFWAYTRSWVVPALLPALERLRSLKNVHLFASVDLDMPDAPKLWRVAYLETDPRAKGLPCLHQYGKAASCHECRYCFKPGKGSVIFKIH